MPTDIANETDDARAVRHTREIQDIIDEHTMLAINKEGRELIDVRQKCSRAIAEACARHVRENNIPRADRAEAAESKPADEQLGGQDFVQKPDDVERHKSTG